MIFAALRTAISPSVRLSVLVTERNVTESIYVVTDFQRHVKLAMLFRGQEVKGQNVKVTRPHEYAYQATD